MRAKQPIIVLDKADQAPEILASAIVDVAAAARKLLASRLTKRAVVVLLKDSIGTMSMRDIEFVLDHAATLDRYTKKPATKEAP
jgi:hypothetical protein